MYRVHFRETVVPLPRSGVSLQDLFGMLPPPRVLGLVERARYTPTASIEPAVASEPTAPFEEQAAPAVHDENGPT